MRQKFQFPILAVILVFLWSSLAQAQPSDGAKVEDDAAANPEQLRILAEKDDRDAQYRLAEKYRTGSTVEQNHERAIELYNLSAAQGFASSQFRLGELYEEGEILDRNIGKAIEFYREAAEQGHPGAQYALALTYQLGSGVEQDIAVAIDWYRKAAQQGHASSHLALGDQYRMGLAVPRDLAESTKWYRRAAEKGNHFAQYELGNAYRYGNGVEQDIAHALEWYRLSAEAGNPSAKLVLTEFEAGDTAAERVMASTPALEVSRDSGLEVLAGGSETDLAFSETAIQAAAVEEAATPLPEPQDVAQIAPSAPRSDTADPATVPGAELAHAAEPSYSAQKEVSLLLAHAQDQVAKLALTTPEGDNAYETYQLILSFQPNNEPALDGIEQIGVKYVELANLAAAKGDFQKTRHYAAKAVELAPEHPSARWMTVPVEAFRPSTQEASPSPEILADFRVPPLAPAAPREESARVEVAVATPATARPEELFEDADDLVLNPADYQGRQVAVAGPVGYVFWDYRLVAESGRNSIVIDIDGLSQADRDKLDAAIDEAGFFGEVRARIKGTVEPQFLRNLQLGATRWSVRSAIFQLAATELSLGEVGASDGKILGAGSDPDFDEATSLVVPVYPGEPLRYYQSQEDLKQARKYVKSLPSTCIGEVIQAESGSVSIYTNCAGQRSKIKIWQGKVLSDYGGRAFKRARPI